MSLTRLRPSFTFTEERIAELKAVVPEAFADGRINWDTLREALGNWIEPEGEGAEHFGLFWPGKREARRLAAVPSRGTLTPVPGEGVNEESTRNLFIEGDNLEVLKLLQKSYAGRVKMIYIDPPYNTGGDFLYKDDFSDPLGTYLRKAGSASESGDILTTNTRADGRFHSNWLSMMYPRLRLARTLLQDGGVIFISIDDNELHNLRALMNEVFGEEDYVETFSWVRTRTPAALARKSKKVVEYILCFEKQSSGARYKGIEKPVQSANTLLNQTNRISELTLPPGTPTGIADGTLKPGRYGSSNYNVELLDTAVVRSGVFVTPVKLRAKFRWTQRYLDQQLASGVHVRVASEKLLPSYEKDSYGAEAPPNLIDSGVGVGTNEHGGAEVEALFGAGVMDYPKPLSLIQYLIRMVCDADDIVLDFFAGSGTTGHAVMASNAADGTNRQFILVQLPEPTPAGSTAKKCGYDTIAQIAKDRLRRAIDKLVAPHGHAQTDDRGFRVFRLWQSNFRGWDDYHGDDIEQLEVAFEQSATPLHSGWERGSVLTEVLLLQGFPLDAVVKRQPEITSNDLRVVTSPVVDHRLFVCLDDTVHKSTVSRLDLKAEDVLVCLDSALDDESKLRLADRCMLQTV